MHWSLAFLLTHILVGLSLYSCDVHAMDSNTSVFAFGDVKEEAFALTASTQECTPVALQIQFDEYPMEVSYELVCDENTIWVADKGRFNKLFSTHIESACLVAAKECQFTIRDNPDYRDGLSSPFNKRPGNFALTLDGEDVLTYDGKDTATATYYELSSPVFCVGKKGCGECMDVVIYLKLDGNPSDTGYNMYCGDQEIWNKPLNSFRKSQGWANAEVLDQTCVPQSACCWFMVFDSPKPLRFELTYGGAPVAQSDGILGTGFTELGYEFGDCNKCVDVFFSLMFDENPGETGFTLTCDDILVWDKPQYSFLASEGFSHKSMKEKACVERFACCVLTVSDSPLWQDGLTSPQAGLPGNFILTYDDTVVAHYNGAEDGPFTNLVYSFGQCDSLQP